MNITEFSCIELNKKLLNKELSCVETANAYLDSVKKQDKVLNAFITYDENLAEKAKELDKKLSETSEVGAMFGVPVAVKDNIMTKGIRTTCASKILENFVPPYNATVIDKLYDSDALLIGKTNMDEFAVGGSNENSYFGAVRNPIDNERVPGGSSGGSAAAVAAKEASVSLGSDTGGSIRQPASFCGIVGIKPTYGLVSRFGVSSMANTLDQVGTFGREVRDAFYALKAVAGYDSKDGTSLENDCLNELDFSLEYEDAVQASIKEIKGKKLAIPKEFFVDHLDTRIKKRVMEVVEAYSKLGVEAEYVNVPHLEYALPAYYAIVMSELSSNLARFDGVRYGKRVDEYDTIDELFKKTRNEGFGEEVKRRIILGTYCTQGGFSKNYYRKALQAKTLIIKDFNAIFEEYDFIISPTVPTLPYRLGEKFTDPMSMYLADVYTVPLNLTGNCGISVPCGMIDGLPTGFQLMGKRFDDAKLYHMGLSYEGSR